MWIIYTSSTCPRGVQALQWCAEHEFLAQECNLDTLSQEKEQQRAELLLQSPIEGDSTERMFPILLPSLVWQDEKTQEQTLICRGFDPRWWQSQFLANKQKNSRSLGA